jgi:hypothetical protein
VSQDATTAAFIGYGAAAEDGGTKNDGLWVWRKGQKTPRRLAPGYPEGLALSRDGKYVAASLGDAGSGVRHTGVWDTTTGKRLWRTEGRCTMAFDAKGERLAMCVATKSTGISPPPDILRWTPTTEYRPHDLRVPSKFSLGYARPLWGSDGSELIFTTSRKGRWR